MSRTIVPKHSSCVYLADFYRPPTCIKACNRRGMRYCLPHQRHIRFPGIVEHLDRSHNIVNSAPIIVKHLVSDGRVVLHFPVVVSRGVAMIVQVGPHGCIDNHTAAPWQILLDPLSRLILSIGLRTIPEDEGVAIETEIGAGIRGKKTEDAEAYRHQLYQASHHNARKA